jgi:hypothetical protein
MRLIIGFLGVIICLASMVVLGSDITAYINSGFLISGHFKFTTLMDTLHVWRPDTWMMLVNYINEGAVSFQKTVVETAVEIPMPLLGLAVGFLCVLVGFRVERFYKD